ncbi:MAG: TolC family protein [Chitinophagaceae bacterium]
MLRNFVQKNLFIILISCLGLHAHAQDMLTVHDAIGAALQHNYDIRTVRIDSASYAINNEYKNAVFLPQFSATATRLFNSNNQRQQLSDGSIKERDGIKSNNLQASVNMNLVLFDGFRMFATREKYAEFIRLGSFAIRQQVTVSVADVVNNYYNIVRQKQQLKAIEEQISINNERVQLADKKFSVGLGAKPELLQAKVDLNAQKAAHLTQETLIAQLKEQLNQLMGSPVTNSFEVADSIPINHDLIISKIRSEVEENNPALQVAKKNIDISRLIYKEVKADLYPYLSLNSAFNFSRVNNAEVINTFTPLFNRNKGLNYGLTLNVPILRGFNTRRLTRQAKLDIETRQVAFDNQFSQIDVSVNNAFKNYELYKKLLNLEEDNILLAKENVIIALQRFKLGISTNLELRAAQLSLEQGYDRLIAARYNTKVAETVLLRLQGNIVTETK